MQHDCFISFVVEREPILLITDGIILHRWNYWDVKIILFCRELLDWNFVLQIFSKRCVAAIAIWIDVHFFIGFSWVRSKVITSRSRRQHHHSWVAVRRNLYTRLILLFTYNPSDYIFLQDSLNFRQTSPPILLLLFTWKTVFLGHLSSDMSMRSVAMCQLVETSRNKMKITENCDSPNNKKDDYCSTWDHLDHLRRT